MEESPKIRFDAQLWTFNTERKISKRLKSPLLKKVDVVIEDD
jgi:hypothetical protein